MGQFFDASGDEENGWVGSPWVGLSIADRMPARTLRASFGVAPPLTSVLPITGSALVVAGWSGWDEWLGWREAVPLGLSGMGEWRAAELAFGVEVALVVAPRFVPEGYLSAPPTGFHGWAALAAWLTGHLSRELDLGARLQAVGRLTSLDPTSADPASLDTAAHVALIPYCRYWFTHESQVGPAPRFLELRMHFNFVAPFGPSFASEVNVWSLALASGTHW